VKEGVRGSPRAVLLLVLVFIRQCVPRVRLFIVSNVHLSLINARQIQHYVRWRVSNDITHLRFSLACLSKHSERLEKPRLLIDLISYFLRSSATRAAHARYARHSGFRRTKSAVKSKQSVQVTFAIRKNVPTGNLERSDDPSSRRREIFRTTSRS